MKPFLYRKCFLKVTDKGVEQADPVFTSDFPGSGPRHISIDESRQIVYVVHELKSLVLIYKIDPDSGVLVSFWPFLPVTIPKS